jgi:pimeloyl-ACP methyl ester carboxylesterase
MIERVPVNEGYCAPVSPKAQAIDWRTHARDVSLDGRRVRYVDVGEGTLGFICVHGLGGCWQHWTQTLAMLSEHGRALAIDLPGFGASQLPRQAITLELFADTAAQLARFVGLERVVFIGHSMAGPIALRFATRHPGLTHKLILVAGAVASFSALLGLRDVHRIVHKRPIETLATYTEALTSPLPVPRPLRRAIAKDRRLRAATLWPYVWSPQGLPPATAELILKGAGARGGLPTVQAIGKSDPYEGLSEIACPILSVGGQYDRIAPQADFEAFQRIAPRAKSVLLEGAGHMMMLERPNAFNEQIRGWL